MKLKDFSGGLNTFDPNINIEDNQCASLLNNCYEEGAILRSRYGFTNYRTIDDVRGIYHWYKGGNLHQIYTAASGLYDNSDLLSASFTGAFHAAEYGSMLYLVNGTYNKRYDGTTLLGWGVSAPDAPTVQASSKNLLDVDDMERVGVPLFKDSQPMTDGYWARKFDSGGTHGRMASGTAASEFFDGAKSLYMVCSEGQTVNAHRHFATAASGTNYPRDFSSDADDDYFVMWYRTPRPEDISEFQLYFYSGNGATYRGVFAKYFVPGQLYESRLKRTIQDTTENLTEDSQSLLYAEFVPGDWAKIMVPKIDFEKTGYNSLVPRWSEIYGMEFSMKLKLDTAGASLGIYFDEMSMVSAGAAESGMYGKYYFVANYYNSTRDEHFAVSTESAPVVLDLQGVIVSGVPSTFDDQANQYKVWARRSDWKNWYLLGTIDEGTTSQEMFISDYGLQYENELTYITGMWPANVTTQLGVTYTRLGTNNTAPPVADAICMHRGKMFFAVDDKIYHSKPEQPWAVPTGHYIIATSDADTVQAFYSDGMDLTVFSKQNDFSYLMAGEYDANNMYQGTLIAARAFKRGCISPHSVSDGIYASTQGICLWDGQQGKILSRIIRPTYREVSTLTTLHAVVWEDMYLLINPSGDSIVCETTGNGIRFYLWAFSSTARCCTVDRVTNKLYIGTDTGIYYYDTSTYKDSEGAFTFRARTKNFEFAPEDSEAGLERFTVHSNTGGNSISTSVYIDDVSHGSTTISRTTRGEDEAFVDLGGAGSFVQARFNGSVTKDSPIRIYGIEIT